MHLLREVLILHGVGVGGGSLLYANTHFAPPDTVWDDPQWKDLERWREIMPAHFETARRMLGSTPNPRMGPADDALLHANHVVVLTDPRSAVAVVGENLAHRCGVLRNDARVAGEASGGLQNDAGTGRVVIVSGQQGRAGR